MSIRIDASDLTRNIGKEIDLTAELIKETIAKMALDIHADLVVQSPVDKGAFRADWTVEINDNGAVIQNTKEYAERLARGWSKQAPAGWVDDTVDRHARGE